MHSTRSANIKNDHSTHPTHLQPEGKILVRNLDLGGSWEQFQFEVNCKVAITSMQNPSKLANF